MLVQLRPAPGFLDRLNGPALSQFQFQGAAKQEFGAKDFAAVDVPCHGLDPSAPLPHLVLIVGPQKRAATAWCLLLKVFKVLFFCFVDNSCS